MAWVITHEFPQIKKLPQKINIYPIGDMQLSPANRSCDWHATKRTLKEIAEDPFGAVIITGDIEDDDRPSTRVMRKKSFADREDVITGDGIKHMGWLDKEVIPLLLPLAKMPYGIIGVLAGHHWFGLTKGDNSVKYICRELQAQSRKPVPYLGVMSAFVRLKFNAFGQILTKVIHVQHGVGGGGATGSSLRNLEKASKDFEADVYIRAHDCQIEGKKKDVIYPKATEIKPELLHKTKVWLNIGSMTRAYEMTQDEPTYPEQAAMSPSTLGWGIVHFNLRYASTHENKSQGLTSDIRIEF